jgi:hypothetical protein
VSGLNLLTPGKALVENNTFHRLRTCGVGMAVDSLSWFESAPVRDVLIRGNTFIECGVWVNPDLSVVQPEEPIHENIRIIDNVFVKTGVKAKGVRKLTITGNRSADGPLLIEKDSSCTEVKIENNEPRK